MHSGAASLGVHFCDGLQRKVESARARERETEKRERFLEPEGIRGPVVAKEFLGLTGIASIESQKVVR